MLSPLLGTCLVGASLGLRHAFDADHVAAITTLVTRGSGPRQAAAVGASWGLGHALAVVGFGAALVALGVRLPASLVVLFDLAVVGLMLLLGVRSLRSASHRARHPAHDHAPARVRSAWQSIGVGVVHGVSGTAAAALLAVSRTPSQALGVVFLLVFAAAATLSMTGISFLLAMPLAAVSRRSGSMTRWAQGLAGALALGTAAFVLVETLHGEARSTEPPAEVGAAALELRDEG